MTLVLPFGCDQIASNSLFSGSGSNQNSSMPCVFDSDAFDRDLESALMTDWTSDIADYEMPAAESPLKTPSDSSDLKRKSDGDFEQQSSPKKLRIDSEASVSPIQSEIVSSSSCNNPNSSNVSSVPSSPFPDSPLDTSSTSTSCSSSSSSSSSSSEGGQDDEVSVDADDEDFLPRRRGPQMWNSRQRWKDERKKVLKMSINKLADIEDPELCLLRSVLINNTIKKLHLDIRNERQAKLRHRQQRLDFFAERFPPFSSSPVEDNVLPECFTMDFSNSASNYSGEAKPTNNANTADFQDDSSCDEIFGINEDFLRVPIPDRRVSSPIPTSSASQQPLRSSSSDNSEPMDGVTTPPTNNSNCSSPCCSNSSSCDTATESSFRTTTQNNSQTVVSTPSAFPQTSSTPPHNSRRVVGSLVSPISNGGSHCAMQYRTNRDLGGGSNGEVSFPPRVPILDSVVYHSLLASLESS